jgi:hypothetical protein
MKAVAEEGAAAASLRRQVIEEPKGPLEINFSLHWASYEVIKNGKPSMLLRDARLFRF